MIEVDPVRLPDNPETAIVAVTSGAVLLAVKVSVLVVVAGFVLNDAVTPLGRPDADKLTPPLKPFCGVTVILLVALAPCAIVKLAGEAERLKLPTEFTASAMLVVCVKVPEVPETVRETVPMVAVLLAVKVSVLAAVAGLGLNDAVTPAGRPDTARVTLPLKPFSVVTVIVLVPMEPRVSVKRAGAAESA